jgi:hypothetical protein
MQFHCAWIDESEFEKIICLSESVNFIQCSLTNLTEFTIITTIKQSQPIGCARLNIMPPTNNFEP